MKYKTLLHTSIIILFLVIVFSLAGIKPLSVAAQSQSPSGTWELPVNLSLSGAASMPAIAVEPDGTRHVIWWDDFDWACYKMFTPGKGWSNTVTINIVSNFAFMNRKPVTKPAKWTLLADNKKGIYLFWSDSDGDFWVGKSISGSLTFSGTMLAKNTLTWQAQIDSQNAIHIIYIQANPKPTDLNPFKTYTSPPPPIGVYYLHSNNGVNWDAAKLIKTSPYFRTLSVDDAYIQVFPVGKNKVYLTWDDPSDNQAYIVYSENNGGKFNDPHPIQTGGVVQGVLPSRAIFLSENSDEYMVLWQAGSSCNNYQQRWLGSSGDNTTTLTPEIPGGPGWSGAERIMENLPGCIQSAQGYNLKDGHLALIIQTTSGKDPSPAPVLAIWDGQAWTDPYNLELDFIDPTTNQTVTLGCTAFTSEGTLLLAVGCDANNDIWSTTTTVDISQIVPSQEKAWAESNFVSGTDGVSADLPALSIDNDGNLHAIYPMVPINLAGTLSQETGQGRQIAYTNLTNSWSQPVSVLQSSSSGIGASDQTVSNPAIEVDPGGMIYAVWSTSPAGQIYYSHAFIRDAGATTGWSAPIALPAPSPAGASPNLALGSKGRAVYRLCDTTQ